MLYTPYGAAGEVTGSMHLLTVNGERILLDCGMFQGRRKESQEKNRNMPIDPGIITNVVLSHAHIDHCGRIPVLIKKGFLGRVVATRPTADVSRYLLRDSAHIQESDAEYLNYKTVRSHLYQMDSGRDGKISHKKMRSVKKLLKDGHRINSEVVGELIEKYRLRGVEPLYSTEEAEQAMTYFAGYPYMQPVEVGKNVTCTFYEAGHILGSAVCLIKIKENGRTRRVLYSGDLGRFSKPIIKDPFTGFPEEDRVIDLLILESTYGNRLHDPVADLKDRLKKILVDTGDRGGSVLIPSFAFGRTQELIYVIHEIYDEKEIKPLPVYIDSPLASQLTKVYGEHPEVYDQATHREFLEWGENPFMFAQINFVGAVEESMALMRESKPNVVISGSGMCEAGRILHHLRYKIHNPLHTILIVGYMAENTLGRRILDLGRAYAAGGRQGPVPQVKFLGKVYPLQAQVEVLEGFSAHGDRDEMLRFLEESRLKVNQVALVHGEDEQLKAFKEFLAGKGYNVSIPRFGESMIIP